MTSRSAWNLDGMAIRFPLGPNTMMMVLKHSGTGMEQNGRGLAWNMMFCSTTMNGRQAVREMFK
jgi:hypothetical protein